MTQPIKEQIKDALRELDELYNAVSNGEKTFTRTGKEFHAVTGYKAIRALTLALEHIQKEEN